MHDFVCRIDDKPANDLLYEAVLKSDLTECECVIRTQDEEVSIQEINKYFLLHVCIKKNEPKLLSKLIDAAKEGVKSSKEDMLLRRNGRKQTPLLFAIRVRNVECCGIIMNKGRSETLLAKDDEGNTALHFIAEEKLFSVFVQAINVFKEDDKMGLLRVANKRNETLLHAAARSGCVEIMQEWVQIGFSVTGKTNNGFTALHFAAKNGHKECIKFLLNNVKADDKKTFMNSESKTKQTALMLAADKGFNMSCYLLGKSDLNKQDKEGWTALHYAAKKGSESVVKYLLNKCADCMIFTRHGKTALMFAVANDNDGCASLLLDADHNNCNGSLKPYDTLRSGVLKRSTRCVSLLLKEQQFRDVLNEVDQDGNTLLHLALKIKCNEVALVLLEAGAQKNRKNMYDEYPLHLASQNSFQNEEIRRDEEICVEEKVIDILVKNSEQMGNEITKVGKNCLHLCAESGNSYLLKRLLLRDCNTFTNNSSGQTPLQVAVEEFQDEALRELLYNMKKKNSNKSLREVHKAMLTSIEKANICALKMFIKTYEVSL